MATPPPPYERNEKAERMYRGITPLREDDLTNKVGAVNDKALTRID